MDYQTFLQTIYLRHAANMKLGLERMEAVLDGMGSPERKLHGVHIAGTNGKGSTCAAFEALALAHGRTTGMNTSPHLVDYRERFRINGRPIAEADLMDAYFLRRDLFEANDATFFEISTALAFDLFHRLDLDTSIIEVGLGGRLDGTKPFTPDVTVITGIALDHTKTLGDTVDKIAFEKTGILKENTPLVMGDMPPEAAEVILHRAGELSIPVVRWGIGFSAENIRVSLDGTTFDFHDGAESLPDLRVNLLGAHQAHNAAVALVAFQRYAHSRGFAVDRGLCRAALARVDWPGRMQILRTAPLVILDGAHNDNGVEALVANLQNLFPGRKFRFVLAILGDKTFEHMIDRICILAERAYITRNASDRAATADEQADRVRANGVPHAIYPDVVSATRAAVDDASPEDIVIVTGSLYTIAEVLADPGKATGAHV
jgi:dihydrofolate synthase / folylpolyglutamate synthase